MSANEIIVSNGPGKDDLLRAVANPDKHLHVMFHTASEPLEAHIDAIDEEGLDGLRFALRGRLEVGALPRRAFHRRLRRRDAHRPPQAAGCDLRQGAQPARPLESGPLPSSST